MESLQNCCEANKCDCVQGRMCPERVARIKGGHLPVSNPVRTIVQIGPQRQRDISIGVGAVLTAVVVGAAAAAIWG